MWQWQAVDKPILSETELFSGQHQQTTEEMIKETKKGLKHIDPELSLV